MPRRVHGDDVRAIRRFHRHGYSIVDLAERFGLGRQCVSNIVNGKTHRDITDNDAVPALADVPVRTPRLKPPRPPVDVAAVAAQLAAQRACGRPHTTQ